MLRAAANNDSDGRPFHYEELLARIRAVLRRVAPPERDYIEVGELRIDRAARRVLIAGVSVVLAAKEYDLLVKLAGDPTRVFTKEELLREVWGFRSLGGGRTLEAELAFAPRATSEVSPGYAPDGHPRHPRQT